MCFETGQHIIRMPTYGAGTEEEMTHGTLFFSSFDTM
jgi:hypothetical protein